VTPQQGTFLRRLETARRAVSSPADALLAARMAGWVAVLPLLKFALPLPRLVRLMASGRRTGALDSSATERIGAISRLLYRVRAVGVDDNCLERSLVAYRYLGRAGAAPELHVGLRRDPGGPVAGHVWVTVDSVPLHEQAEDLASLTGVVSFGPDGRALTSSGTPIG
jgi:hypothetical protein